MASLDTTYCAWKSHKGCQWLGLRKDDIHMGWDLLSVARDCEVTELLRIIQSEKYCKPRSLSGNKKTYAATTDIKLLFPGLAIVVKKLD